MHDLPTVLLHLSVGNKIWLQSFKGDVSCQTSSLHLCCQTRQPMPLICSKVPLLWIFVKVHKKCKNFHGISLTSFSADELPIDRSIVDLSIYWFLSLFIKSNTLSSLLASWLFENQLINRYRAIPTRRNFLVPKRSKNWLALITQERTAEHRIF